MGYSQEGLAAVIGVERSTVARWEQGRTDPKPENRAELARALDVDLNELDRLIEWTRESSRVAVSVGVDSDADHQADDAVGTEPSHRQNRAPEETELCASSGSETQEEVAIFADPTLLRPWTAQDTLDAVRELLEGGDSPFMNRRSFLMLSGVALTSPAHDWLIARPIDETVGRSGRVIEPSFVDHLGEITDSIRRMDDKIGGGSLIGVVRSQAAYVQTLLSECSYSDSVGRDLYAAMAELLRLAGWLSFDAGRHGEAQRFFIAALRGAHVAGDRALGANILGFMSCQAKDIGQPREATRLAESACAGYAGASPTVTAIVNMRAAQAYANVNDKTAARRSIDTALAAMGGAIPQHGVPAWSYWLDEAQINEQVGYCYMRLGDWPRAREHLLAAILAQGSTKSREGVLRQALLASTYAQQGDPEAACKAGNQAIDALMNHIDSERCVGHIQRVVDHLQPFSELSFVREFAERVRGMEVAAV
jgi:transcriptional regulator with XRE-family HTH domain/tetratricopeptide (TPR) repeat protein